MRNEKKNLPTLDTYFRNYDPLKFAVNFCRFQKSTNCHIWHFITLHLYTKIPFDIWWSCSYTYEENRFYFSSIYTPCTCIVWAYAERLERSLADHEKRVRIVSTVISWSCRRVEAIPALCIFGKSLTIILRVHPYPVCETRETEQYGSPLIVEKGRGDKW